MEVQMAQMEKERKAIEKARRELRLMQAEEALQKERRLESQQLVHSAKKKEKPSSKNSVTLFFEHFIRTNPLCKWVRFCTYIVGNFNRITSEFFCTVFLD